MKPAKSVNNHSDNCQSGSSATVAIQLPGIDNSQVIAAQPYLIKENSSKEQHKEIKVDKA